MDLINIMLDKIFIYQKLLKDNPNKDYELALKSKIQAILTCLAEFLGYVGFSFRTTGIIAILFENGTVVEVNYTDFKELVTTDYEWIKLYGPKHKE